MAIVGLLFLIAVVGIIKPFVPGSKRAHFIGLAVLSAVGAQFVRPVAQKSAPSLTAAPDTVKTTETVAPVTASEAAKPTEPSSKWVYSEDRDDMRGTIAQFAHLESDNSVDLAFPYGQQTGQIVIRRNHGETNVMFAVASGQILCHEYDETYLFVKFDNGPVKKFRCVGSSSGNSNTAFFKNEALILSGLRRAHRTIIEGEFYDNGPRQFTFNTAGLKWR